MALYFYKQFLIDLTTVGDANCARRILSKVIDRQGEFSAGSEDHRYDGIDDAWIRYVSVGGPAFRVIYIRKGPDVFLYRAGPHSIEDNLPRPKASAEVVPVVPAADLLNAQYTMSEVGAMSAPALGIFLQNYKGELIRTRVLGRRFIRHKEVILVSPYVGFGLFTVYSPFGKVLYDFLEEGADVVLITRPPASMEELKFFERLEADGIVIFFNPLLHAKLLIFDVDETAFQSEELARAQRMALVGSANLTKEGLGIGATVTDNTTPYEELVYELPSDQFDAAKEFATYLTVVASDIPKERVRLARMKKS